MGSEHGTAEHHARSCSHGSISGKSLPADPQPLRLARDSPFRHGHDHGRRRVRAPGLPHLRSEGRWPARGGRCDGPPQYLSPEAEVLRVGEPVDLRVRAGDVAVEAAGDAELDTRRWGIGTLGAS